MVDYECVKVNVVSEFGNIIIVLILIRLQNMAAKQNAVRKIHVVKVSY